MNNANRTFTFVGIIVFILLAMYQLPTLSIGKTQLRSVDILSSVLPEPKEKDIDVIPTTPKPKPQLAKTSSGKTIAFKETYTKGVEPIIDYSNNGANGMEHFYWQLNNIKKINRPIRIAYYGDSYIEGDILTSDLRELFQKNYGGNGIGWIDCGSTIVSSRRTITQQFSGIKEFAAIAKPFDKTKQGISERYFVASNGATIKTNATKLYPHTKQWTNTTLFFYAPNGIKINYALSNNKKGNREFIAKNSIQTLELKDTTSTISYSFNNVGANTFLYGMALEGNKGIVLDNFSMRGSSGLTLADIPQNTLKEFNKLRPYDLIIIHFGLNTAVKGNPTSVIRNYASNIKKVINNFKSAFPNTSILVFSVPDKDQRTADGIKTIKEVKQLVAFQEQTAAKAQVAFYNFFRAMGGDESVNKLVQRKLANKDYTHINYSGGKYIAQKIFPSFIEGLKNYKTRKAIEKQ